MFGNKEKKKAKELEKLRKKMAELGINPEKIVEKTPEEVKANNDRILAELRAEQDKIIEQVSKPKKVSNPEDRQKMMLKSLYEVEKIVDYCKKKGWTEKSDWEENNIPMKNLVKDMVDNTNAYMKEKKDFIEKGYKET